MNQQATYSALTEQFAPEMERVLKKGGVSLTYIPVSEVINRLNKVIGVDRWSFEIVSCGRDAVDPDYIVAPVRLVWYTNEKDGWAAVTREGFGGQKIKRTKQGEIVDLGDEFKGAVSDALKKAAQTFGVGLYLARSEEAIDAESYYETPSAAAVAQAEVGNDAETVRIWEAFMTFVSTFTDEQKKQLRSDWAEFSDGAPIPKVNTVTLEEAEFLHGQAAAISIGEHFGNQ